MSDGTVTAPAVAPPEDDFSKMVREILRTIDSRIERLVLKHVERAMNEFKVTQNENPTRDTVHEWLDERFDSAVWDFVDEDKVREMIRDALSNLSVNSDY